MLSKFIDSPISVNKLILDRTYEDKFKQPYGILIEGRLEDILQGLTNVISEFKPRLKITVGDYVTKFFIIHGIPIDVAIIDFNVERKSFQYDPKPYFKKIFKVVNPPGTIFASSWLTIQYAISIEEPSLIIVDGEEDLLALPCVLCAPLNSAVFFGIPHRGLMFVPVNFEAKNYAFKLLKFFIPE
ncbi:MAG: GTP-dependent dephospho-CoA kinase family protein [archaeon GBS-70-058]|nr:GTP-dependent dephospho-CoA kinase family protein [Candidatus Culexarchaeum nevadense]